MARYGKRTVAGCPPEAQGVAQELVRLGYEEGTWTLLDEVEAPDRNHREQVRNDKDLAPTGDVNLFTENMRNGDTFPPVIITADGWLLDGNTRVEAAMKLTRKGKPVLVSAFILDDKYEGATQATLDRFKALQLAPS